MRRGLKMASRNEFFPLVPQHFLHLISPGLWEISKSTSTRLKASMTL